MRRTHKTHQHDKILNKELQLHELGLFLVPINTKMTVSSLRGGGGVSPSRFLLLVFFFVMPVFSTVACGADVGCGALLFGGVAKVSHDKAKKGRRARVEVLTRAFTEKVGGDLENAVAVGKINFGSGIGRPLLQNNEADQEAANRMSDLLKVAYHELTRYKPSTTLEWIYTQPLLPRCFTGQEVDVKTMVLV